MEGIQTSLSAVGRRRLSGLVGGWCRLGGPSYKGPEPSETIMFVFGAARAAAEGPEKCSSPADGCSPSFAFSGAAVADETPSFAFDASSLPAINRERCAFCRTPTPDSDADTIVQVQERVDAKDPVAIDYLAHMK